MTKQKIIDIDAELGEDEPLVTKPIKLLGQQFDLVCDLNFFALGRLSSGNPEAIATMMTAMIAPADQARFAQAMSAKPLSPERLDKILAAMVEAAAERPTTPPSASSAGGKNRTSVPKSRAATPPRRVAR